MSREDASRRDASRRDARGRTTGDAGLVPGAWPGTPPGALLADFSLDVTGKDLGELDRGRAFIPPGTRIHVGFTGGQDPAARAGTARAVMRAGFMPVPVIAARRLRSEGMLRQYLDALRAAGASGSVLVVAGDPAQPLGPYPDAAARVRVAVRCRRERARCQGLRVLAG